MWTVKKRSLPQQFHFAAVSIDGNVYSFGSDAVQQKRREPTSRTLNPTDVYVFNPRSYTWHQPETQTLPYGWPWKGAFSTVVAYGQCAYLWDVWPFPRSSVRVIYRFDTTTMTWSHPRMSGHVPLARDSQSVCVVGHRVYIFGGHPRGGVPLQDIEFLDLETLQWHRVPTRGDYPQMYDCPVACAIGSRMYVCGFLTGQADLDQNVLFYLDTDTLTWVRPHVEGVGPEMGQCSGFVYDGELYIFGGYSHKRKTFVAEIYKYQPKNSRWSQVTPRRPGPPVGMHLPVWCVIDKRVFVFGDTRPDYYCYFEGRRLKVSLEMLANMPKGKWISLYPKLVSELNVLDFSPSLTTMCLLTVIDARIDTSALPRLITKEITAMTSED
ncbi:kelch domain-containing protein 3-like [Amblyomma americanum]